MALSASVSPDLVREAFGARDYGRISSVTRIATTAGMPVGTASPGLLYGAAGSCRPGIFFGVAPAALRIFLVETTLRPGWRLSAAAAQK